MSDVRPPPPAPPDLEDVQRWEHTALARRILDDQWLEDLEKIAQQAIGHIRREAWKVLDDSKNPFRAFMEQLARSYDRPPAVSHDDAEGAENADAVRRARWWIRSRRRMRDTLGLQEMLVRVDVLPDGTPTYRLVYPDRVVAVADLDRPWLPVSIQEARCRRHPETGRQVWVWDQYDISGREPVYRVVDAEGRVDLSDLFLTDADGRPLGALEGDAYPYRWPESDDPLLPCVLYHGADTGDLWNWTANRGLVRGTLRVGLYYSFFGHVLLNGAWQQRYGVDVDVDDGEPLDEDGDGRGRQGVTTDPATLVRLRGTSSERQPVIGQWSSPTDPVRFLEAIRQYEQAMASYAGVTGADQIRMSGDPRSGYAVSISREALREVQAAQEPHNLAGDQDLLAITAALRSRVLGRRIPTDGYAITYRGIPRTAMERQAEQERRAALIEAGLMDVVTAYREEHPHLTEAQAIEELRRIQELNRRFRG